jgi:hypothetical protein
MAGPVGLPADQAALVALGEVTVHAWDLAVSAGQPFDAGPGAVADDAPDLDRLPGAPGRDSRWSPESR